MRPKSRSRKPRVKKTSSQSKSTRSRSRRGRNQHSDSDSVKSSDQTDVSSPTETIESEATPTSKTDSSNIINHGASTSTSASEDKSENSETVQNSEVKSEKNSSQEDTPDNAKERFNKSNKTVTPLKKCSELTPNSRYRILNIVRTNTKFGVGIRSAIVDVNVNSPTGSCFVFLPSRHRNMSDNDIVELNSQANSVEGLYLVYHGRVGRADMIELV